VAEIFYEPWVGFTLRSRRREIVFESEDEALEGLIAAHVEDPEEALARARADFYES
jgi:hypothetical protein